jgi:molecular chaperone DnaK
MTWRRHLRRLDPGDRRWRVRGEVDNGDTFLGGEDFDAKMSYSGQGSRRIEELRPYQGSARAAAAEGSAEKAKIELSSAQTTEVNLPFITADATGPKHLVRAITRADLERLVDR